MSKLNLSIEQLEDEITAAYKDYLVVTMRLTPQQARNAEYSYALPEIRPAYEEYEVPSREELERRFKVFVVSQLRYKLAQNEDIIKSKICVDAEYCKNRNSEGLNIIVTTLDGFISTILGYPIPAFTVLAWLIKTRWLDGLCACS